MFNVDWQADANIVYLSNLCFPDEMNFRIAREAEKARPGTWIIALKFLDEEIIKGYLRLERLIDLNMTWGNQPVKVYIRE